MRFYRDVGIVLGGHKLGEADRIVIILTRNHGLIRAVAKGIRRTKSRFGSRLEPFMFVDVQCHIGRSLDIITQAEDKFGVRIDEMDLQASMTVKEFAELIEARQAGN